MAGRIGQHAVGQMVGAVGVHRVAPQAWRQHGMHLRQRAAQGVLPQQLPERELLHARGIEAPALGVGNGGEHGTAHGCQRQMLLAPDLAAGGRDHGHQGAAGRIAPHQMMAAPGGPLRDHGRDERIAAAQCIESPEALGEVLRQLLAGVVGAVAPFLMGFLVLAEQTRRQPLVVALGIQGHPLDVAVESDGRVGGAVGSLLAVVVQVDAAQMGEIEVRRQSRRRSLPLGRVIGPVSARQGREGFGNVGDFVGCQPHRGIEGTHPRSIRALHPFAARVL